MNKVGIYHLGGSFWPHLLSTIPDLPYKCMVILDGEHRPEVKEVCEKYNAFVPEIEEYITMPKFELCEEIPRIILLIMRDAHPIYCLEKRCIEKYFYDNTLPSNYDKKQNLPEKVEKSDVPEEIKKIFRHISPFL